MDLRSLASEVIEDAPYIATRSLLHRHLDNNAFVFYGVQRSKAISSHGRMYLLVTKQTCYANLQPMNRILALLRRSSITSSYTLRPTGDDIDWPNSSSEQS